MTETPDYSVIRKENDIELRLYPAYIKAEVTVNETSYRKAVFKGFNTLADYIFGNNIKTEKIAMTTPVQVSQSQKIAMTKPVTVSGDGNYTVAFIMPSEFTLDTLPKPKNSAVQFTSVPPLTMAAIRYSGYFQGAKISKAKQRLHLWLEKEGLESEGDYIVAGYNPPWVPGFLTRNEVMIMIKI
ncbi:MAG: heme-binding protein [Anaerolineaceae bacterium]|nr:heme-binding protein [Anaerolineaceae bacterium]